MSPEFVASELRAELAEAREAHAAQARNYAALYEAVVGEGTRTADFRDPCEIARQLRAELYEANKLLVEMSIELGEALADKALLDFLEKFKGNLWIDRDRWTLFMRVGGRDSLPLQPTGDTLREVLRKAMVEAEGKVPVWRGR